MRNSVAPEVNQGCEEEWLPGEDPAGRHSTCRVGTSPLMYDYPDGSGAQIPVLPANTGRQAASFVIVWWVRVAANVSQCFFLCCMPERRRAWPTKVGEAGSWKRWSWVRARAVTRLFQSAASVDACTAQDVTGLVS